MSTKGLPLTVIDEPSLRGVLASPGVISKELLDDLVDFIELSSPLVTKAVEVRATEADRHGGWLSSAEVERRFKARQKKRPK